MRRPGRPGSWLWSWGHSFGTAQLFAARTEAPAAAPAPNGSTRVLGQHARHLIPGDPYCGYLDVCLAPQVTGPLGGHASGNSGRQRAAPVRPSLAARVAAARRVGASSLASTADT